MAHAAANEERRTMQRNQRGGGVFIMLGLVIGGVIGAFQDAGSVGAAVGGAIGVVVAVAMWWRERGAG
jgi:uncharacterized protein YqgC (DUF456 family)